MIVYTASLIDKSLRSINAALAEQLMTDYRKSLQTQRSEIFSHELNTFIVLSAKKTVDSVDDTIFKKVEEGKPRKRLEKYYREIGSRLRKYLKHNQELRETSRIIKDFLKEVDSTLIKKFNERLREMNHELPKENCEIYSKSYVTLWSIEENQKHQITLSAFDSPIFTNETPKTPVEMGRFFDKLIVVNFSAAFLKPTIIRLQAIDQVLEKLNKVLIGTHYKSSDKQLQAKQEWFLRILEAKLSALQDVGTLVSRVLDQFRYPLPLLPELDFQNASQNLNAELETIESDIASGEKLLTRVCKSLPQSQIQLREYFSEDKNEVVTISTSEEFKRTHLTIAELSIELFTEAELLKMWLDTFASDIPYFSFNTPLFDPPSSSRIKVASDTILAARGLVKNYSLGRTTAYAVRGVDLDIKEGEFVAIVGSSGAGKTTLLNCLAGLDTPDHGVVLFHGENLHDKNDAAKSAARLHEMGFIFQSYALLPHFDTRENVALPADLAGLSEDLRARIESLLKDVGIDQQAEQYPAQLSGGQMQRVAIARALTNRPKIIFADEPTGDLDSVTGKHVMELLKKFHEETSTTVIVITHEQDVADYAERQVTMEDGVITAIPSPLAPHSKR